MAKTIKQLTNEIASILHAKVLSGKRAFYYHLAYKFSNNYFLSDCYKKPSVYKQRAFEYCVNECDNYEGKGLKILKFTRQNFTVGYVVENTKAGDILVIETTCNRYIVVGYSYEF